MVSCGESFFFQNFFKKGGKLTVHLDPYVDHIFRWMGCTVGLKISSRSKEGGWWLGIGVLYIYSLPVSTEFNFWTKNNVSVVFQPKKKRGYKSETIKHTFSLTSISKNFLLCVIRRGFGK